MNNNLFNKRLLNLFKAATMISFFAIFGCSRLSTDQKDISIQERKTMFMSQSDSGYLINPGKTKSIVFDFGKKNYPVRQTIRVKGVWCFS